MHLKSLEKLGFNNKEQNVYVALLQLEKATANEVAKKAQIKRPTTYDILNRLKKYGYISAAADSGKNVFVAKSPEAMLELIEDQKNELKAELPILLSVYNSKSKKPKVTYFEGIAGIKELYEDTLRSCKAGNEILAYVTDDFVSVGLYQDDYIKRRIEKGIMQRAICIDTIAIRHFAAKDATEKRITKLIPKKEFPIKNEINIYANKVLLITYKPSPYGVMIESNEIAETWRAIFEMSWKGLPAPIRSRAVAI